MKTEKLKHQTHYVSPESPAGQPTKVDEKHASIETGQPDPLTETQDGLGVIEGANSQQALDPRTIGGEGERTVKPNQQITLGRHVKSDNGFEKAHVNSARKQNQAAFTKKK